MKNATLNFIVLAALMLTSLEATAQLYPVTLEEKIGKSELIVEGEIVQSMSYLGNDGLIYTANELEISKILKGDPSNDKVTIVTLGGAYNGFETTWTHLLTLQKGQKGVFFLSDTKRPYDYISGFPDIKKEVFSSSQGFLEYVEADYGKTFAVEPFNIYTDIENELFACIEEKTGRSRIDIDRQDKTQNEVGLTEGDTDTCIIYKFQPVIDPTLSFQTDFKADILAKTTGDTIAYYKGRIVIQYNTDFFGEYMVANDLIQIEDGDIAQLSAYTLTMSDLASDKIEIELIANTTNTQSLYSLSGQESLIGTVTLSIDDFTDEPDVYIDEEEMTEQSQYVDTEGGGIKNVRCVIIEDLTGVSSMAFKIDSIRPLVLAAGKWDTLYIYGEGFDDDQGNNRVQFKNAHKEPEWYWMSPIDSQYVFWSDTLIKVIVPSIGYAENGSTSSQTNYAGTDKIRVRRSALSIRTSDEELYVKYTADNSKTSSIVNPPNTAVRSTLGNVNGAGGYYLYFDYRFKTIAGGAAAFIRALNTWRCATYVNFEVRDSSAISDFSVAGKISLGDLPAGSVSTLGKTVYATAIEIAAPNNFKYECLFDFEIIFNKSLTWHTDTTKPAPLPTGTYDLETVALHEIGHAHLLKHTNNDDDVMYWTNSGSPANPYRRTLEANDLEGGTHIVTISSATVNPPAFPCEDPMIKLTSSNCEMLVNAHVRDIQKPDIKIFPNPSSTGQTITFEIQEHSPIKQGWLMISNIHGETVFDQKITSDKTSFDLPLTPGTYLVSLLDTNGVLVTKKIIKF